MTPPKPKAIIFDWDNTLVDSWPIIHNAMVETFTKMGTKPWTLEETKEKVGKSLRDHFPTLFGDRWEEAGNIYTTTYREHHLNLEVLPLVKELLSYLENAKGIYVAVVSNKQGPVLRKEAEHMGLTKYFKKLIGSRDAERDKPYPEPLYMALDGSNITPGPDVWFVGDSITDVDFALNSGCTPIFYGDGKLPEHVKDKVFYIDSHGHLVDMLRKHG